MMENKNIFYIDISDIKFSKKNKHRSTPQMKKRERQQKKTMIEFYIHLHGTRNGRSFKKLAISKKTKSKQMAIHHQKKTNNVK